jgi:hypothetical protein
MRAPALHHFDLHHFDLHHFDLHHFDRRDEGHRR